MDWPIRIPIIKGFISKPKNLKVNRLNHVMLTAEQTAQGLWQKIFLILSREMVTSMKIVAIAISIIQIIFK